MRKLILFTVISIIFFFSWSVTTAQKTRAYSETSFDPSVQQLPRNFFGHDAGIIYKQLEEKLASVQKKDEFEITEQFKKRKESFGKQTLFGSLPIDGCFAFKIDANFTYDADTEVLNFSLSFSKDDLDGLPKGLLAADWESGDADAFSMGKKTSYRIVNKNYQDFLDKAEKAKPLLINFITKIKLKPVDAKNLKKALSALVVCNLTFPYIKKGGFSDSPLISFDNYYIHTTVKEILIYDVNSGKVFGKIKPFQYASPSEMLQKKASVRKKADPIYPDLAKRAGLDGNVLLKVWINKEGYPETLFVVRSDAEIFNQYAVNSAVQWLYSPAVARSGAVGSWISIPVTFQTK